MSGGQTSEAFESFGLQGEHWRYHRPHSSKEAKRDQWECFFLGADVMLLETTSINQFALLWGSTSALASLTIAAVLVMALGANWAVAHLEIRWPRVVGAARDAAVARGGAGAQAQCDRTGGTYARGHARTLPISRDDASRWGQFASRFRRRDLHAGWTGCDGGCSRGPFLRCARTASRRSEVRQLAPIPVAIPEGQESR